MNNTIYRDSGQIRIRLKTALKKEWEKYRAMPVKADMVPDHESAQAWGYVVVGYFLIELSLKAVLNLRTVCPPKTHVLIDLFTKLPLNDQDVLREYYNDFLHNFSGMSSFKYSTLDGFLSNLDGSQNNSKMGIGSFDWRYFLIERGSGESMPLVSINLIHEIVYGCIELIRLIRIGSENQVRRSTYSWRLYWVRKRFQIEWLNVRLNSPEWGGGEDRIEITFGPSYGNRYDYFIFKGESIQPYFAPLPDKEQIKFPILDKRSELALFNPEEPIQGLSVRRSNVEKISKMDSVHVMF